MTLYYYHTGAGAYPHIQPGSMLGDLIPSRSLSVSNPGDVVIIPPHLKTEAHEMQLHYASVGLRVAQKIITTTKPLRTISHPHDTVDLYIHNFMSTEYSSLKTLQVQRDVDNKPKFLKLCQNLEINTPRTYVPGVTEGPHGLPYPFLAKIDVSASGEGVFLVKCDEDYRKLLRHGMIQPLQHHLQEFIPNARSLNISLDTFNTHWKWASWQVLDDFMYRGGESITPNEKVQLKNVFTDAEKLRQHFVKLGFLGYVGFDVLITAHDYYFIECNPRWSSSLYSAKVAQKMGWDSWKSKRITTNRSTLVGFPLRTQHKLFKQKKSPVIVGWGGISHNFLDVVGTPEMFANITM